MYWRGMAYSMAISRNIIMCCVPEGAFVDRVKSSEVYEPEL